MAKSKPIKQSHKKAIQQTVPIEPTLPPMTDAERDASRRAYLTCKPALDAALAKIDQRAQLASRPFQPNHPEQIKSGPNIGYRCLKHGLALDPWGYCHHECQTCAKQRPYPLIWTHKGRCRQGGGMVGKL